MGNEKALGDGHKQTNIVHLLSGTVNRVTMIERVNSICHSLDTGGGNDAKNRTHNVITIRHAQPLLIVMALCISAAHFRTALADVLDSDGANDQAMERHPNRGLFADTKYWLGNMDFGNRDNWRDNLKPCTMLERIAIDEDGAVISMGDSSIGLLESASIRQFVLANDGVLLLHSDTLNYETTQMKHLTDNSLHCFDSASLPDVVQDQFWFRFEPHSDQLSWFNPANWKSDLAEEIADFIPESNLIPCSHDVVVFGIDDFDLISAYPELISISPMSSFKVNFRPSESLLASQPASWKPVGSSLRVSKFKIGNKSYTQDEFEQLIELYGGNLFDFDDSQSIFNLGGDNSSDRKQTLIIDETSLSAEQTERERCLEVAGCVCGNEDPQMMKVICSFHQPLETDDLLCRDPIRSSGYCNPICATSIIINMNPFEFNERLVTSKISELMAAGPGGDSADKSAQADPDYFSQSVFTGSRRIDHGKYEITLRIYPIHNEEYENTLGRERELALLLKQHLDRPAIKSFYGIRSVNIISSVQWRRNTQSGIFWIALSVITVILMLELALYEGQLVEDVLYRTNITTIVDWFGFIGNFQSSIGLGFNNIDRDVTTSTSSDPTNRVDGDPDQGLSGHDQDPNMIELDSRSVTDSTLNLLVD